MPNGIAGQHSSPLRNPPSPRRTVDGGIHFLVAAVEAVAKASHQSLILQRPPHGKTLLDGHRTGEADGVGGIAFCLIAGGDIQTLGCCQKLTSTPPPVSNTGFHGVKDGIHHILVGKPHRSLKPPPQPQDLVPGWHQVLI